MEKKLDNSQVGVRSLHYMPNTWLGSTEFGRVVPVFWKECLGTDKVVSYKPRIEVQMLPLATSTFGEIDLFCHCFFVPTRLLWKDFNDFYSRSGVAENATPPYLTAGDFVSSYAGLATDGVRRAFFNHFTSMGLPPFFCTQSNSQSFEENKKISMLPFRAYNQIWWDFFRNPELIPDSNKELYLDVEGGHRTAGNLGFAFLQPRYRFIKDCWLADMFAQNGKSPSNYFSGLKDQGNGNIIVSPERIASQQLRKIEALTRMAERLSLSGKRQIDRLFAQYGIKPEFSKLNMCEYIGGAKSTVLVKDITATASTETDTQKTPLGYQAGRGYCAFNNLNIKYNVKEPGYIMSVVSIMPKLHYVQGLGKEWFRNNLEDWFTRQLEHTGQVAVAKTEVAVNYGSADGNFEVDEYLQDDNDDTFAFTQPYYEYKRSYDILAGDFMNYHPNSSGEQDVRYMQGLNLFTDFPADREFSPENLSIDPADYNKIFNYFGGSLWANSDDHFWLNVRNELKMNRPMDGYAIPTLETTEDPHKQTAPIGSSVVL